MLQRLPLRMLVNISVGTGYWVYRSDNACIYLYIATLINVNTASTDF